MLVFVYIGMVWGGCTCTQTDIQIGQMIKAQVEDD